MTLKLLKITARQSYLMEENPSREMTIEVEDERLLTMWKGDELSNGVQMQVINEFGIYRITVAGSHFEAVIAFPAPHPLSNS